MYSVKYSPLNGATSWRSCSVVPRGCVNRIRLLPLRRDDHSGVLTDPIGTRHSDWAARGLANDVSTRIDRQPDRLHACRDKWQLAATLPLCVYHSAPFWSVLKTDRG